MKHYLALIVVIIMLVGNGLESQGAGRTDVSDDLNRMYSVLNSEGTEMISFEIMMRETISRDDVDTYLSELDKMGDSSEQKTDKASKFVVHTPHKQKTIDERILLVVPTDKEYQAELIYTISGTDWTEKIHRYVQDLTTDAQLRFFTQDATKFACLKAGFGDKISGGVLFQNVMEKLDVQPLTNMQDNVYTTTTGHTTQLKASRSLADNMNIQLALHDGNGQSTVTVGTPIITTEY
ncbi:TATA-box binding [Terribacillus halophilus]|uniref:TATA-box binding n=1 Tax=Terribacillus halophilus TaxID=361279 RepID=A0A1G6IBX4_9BACI|nr:YwmB family TATA-box binding protein [Terribacillus halophilus]SDC04042.1 TATA-box binding [Terribacillus halophilus]